MPMTMVIQNTGSINTSRSRCMAVTVRFGRLRLSKTS
jgi:hypothetical protein